MYNNCLTTRHSINVWDNTNKRESNETKRDGMERWLFVERLRDRESRLLLMDMITMNG